MGESKIEWTEQTWNPIVGCSIVSPGCSNCYAMKQAARTEAMGISRYDGTTKVVNGKSVWTGKLARAPEATLLAPLKRKKPTTYFVNSMGDLFHEDCPDEWIDRVFAVMALSPQHTFQVLTKRAARMRAYFAEGRERMHTRWLWAGRNVLSCYAGGNIPGEFPLSNVWLGVSAERQQEADERIPLLLQTPAAIRFISAEPLLGPINLTRCGIHYTGSGPLHLWKTSLEGDGGWRKQFGDNPPEIDWVIAGGESGPGARPSHPDWYRSLRDQCAVAGVAFFMKQWGGWKPLDQFQTQIIDGAGSHGVIHADGRFVFDTDVADPPHAVFTFRMAKKSAGRLLDGVEHNAMPEMLR